MNIERKTNETQIQVELELWGQGRFQGTCGIGFFDHMLTAFCFYSQMDLKLQMSGDLEVDQHHSLEDLGITLGMALSSLLAANPGYQRFSSLYMPMDESLVRIALDLSGRPWLTVNMPPLPERIGQFETACLKEFLRAFVQQGKCCLHIEVLYGENAHHMVEAIFKGLGRSLKEAVRPAESLFYKTNTFEGTHLTGQQPVVVQSTKGIL